MLNVKLKSDIDSIFSFIRISNLLYSLVRIIKEKVERAQFVSRSNRFVVQCVVDEKAITAYLPNPGRLWELLIPGCTLYLKRNSGAAKIPYTVMAVEKNSIPVMLHTHLTNDVVEMLLRRQLVPGLKDAEIVRREATFGDSRFDFLLQRKGKEFVLEVKNCTLFHDELAMFPDAVTERGSRHLRGLLELQQKGVDAGVLFVVQWPRAQYFMPEYHTDFEFSKVFLKCRDTIFLKAIGLTWQADLSLDDHINELTIPWEVIEKKAHDSGCYIVILHLEKETEIAIGELGTVFFRKGYYLYAGSAKKALTKRLERHQRLRKNLFWHIDYLREKAAFHKGLPIRTSEDIECALAAGLQQITDWSIPRFGCSDCSCKSHLFGMDEDPVKSPAFIEMLYNYRIKMVEDKLGNSMTRST
jgi:sugar fermentation stimulation protein A